MLERVSGTVALASVAILATAALAPLVPGQAAPAGIAVIDNDRVFQESVPGQATADRIQAELTRWQQQIDTAEGELTELQTRQQNQVGTMTPEAAQQLALEIEQKTVEVQRLRDDAQRQLARVRDEALADLGEQLTPAVEQLREQEGYAAVFNTQTAGLIDYDPAVDITDRLIALLGAAPEDEDR